MVTCIRSQNSRVGILTGCRPWKRVFTCQCFGVIICVLGMIILPTSQHL